jgi:hypothetical protein
MHATFYAQSLLASSKRKMNCSCAVCLAVMRFISELPNGFSEKFGLYVHYTELHSIVFPKKKNPTPLNNNQ